MATWIVVAMLILQLLAILGIMSVVSGLNQRIMKLEQAKGEAAPPLRPALGDYFEPEDKAKPRPKWRGADCQRCSTKVPTWFWEQFQGEYICKHCTDAMPYPNDSEDEDMYVERYKKWRAEERAKQERNPA